MRRTRPTAATQQPDLRQLYRQRGARIPGEELEYDVTEPRRVPLVLICGLSPEPNARAAESLRADSPGTVLVHHDLRRIEAGVVRRRVRLGDRDQTTVLELAHGCVSCTLREDLLPLLRQLARYPEVDRIVLRLDEAMEPEPVCWAIDNVLLGDHTVAQDVRIEAVFAVLDLASVLADLTGDDLLAERGLRASADDERTVAQVAIAQAEFADVLLYRGNASDGWTAAKTDAALDRIAPAAPRRHLSTVDSDAPVTLVPPRSRRGEVTDMHGPLRHGQPPLEADCGIATLLFTARRPFHPGRLHDALDVLLDGVIRTRGRAWVASQPDIAFWVESAGGGLGIGHAGPWLAAADGPAWEDVSAERRAMAALRWDPEFGDRAQELVVVTHLATPEEIETALTGALLTDTELVAGETAWLHYEDPFGSWHEEPCEDDEADPDRLGSPANSAQPGRSGTTGKDER